MTLRRVTFTSTAADRFSASALGAVVLLALVLVPRGAEASISVRRASPLLVDPASNSARTSLRGLSGMRPILFPADVAMHPNTSTEWWYIVYHLTDARGRSYGAETTFFKFSGLRQVFPGSPVDTSYRTDTAITDERARRFYSSVAYAPATSRTLASTSGLHLRAGTFSMSEQGRFTYAIRATTRGGRLAMVVRSTRPPMLVQGGLQKFGDGYTYYYSLTSMRASGILTIGGRHIPVTGTAWMDHQWGNWSWTTIIGWNWMAFNLADGTSISLNVERTTLGTRRWAMELSPHNRQIFTGDVTMTALGAWRSKRTGILYPSGWHMTVPSLRLDVVVRPTVKDQEVVDSYSLERTGAAYWEGSSRLVGTRDGRAVTGKAYVELTGYGAQPLSSLL